MKHFFVSLITIFFISTPASAYSAHPGMVQEINRVRVDAKLSSVRENQALTLSATAKACDMRDRGYWAHTAPDGKTGWNFIINSGYSYRYAGENLAKNYKTDREVVDAWMNSSTHKDILLKGVYRDVGIGKCGIYIVAHFATPQKRYGQF